MHEARVSGEVYVRRWIGRQFVIRLVGLFAGLQAGTVLVLWVVAHFRKRRLPPAGFQTVPLHDSVVDGNEIRLYSFGEPLFRDMIAAIDGAQHSILLETFIWKDDETGRMFKDHIVHKAREGVRVFVIFDGFANLVVPRAFKTFPREVHALEYHSWRRPWHIFDVRRTARDHRKLLVVDGAIAFVGGYNLGEAYRTQWRDTHLRVCGPAASRLGQDFIDFWNRNRSGVPAITWALRRGLSPHLVIRRNDAVRLLFPIRNMYVDAIERAEHYVWITTAYFIPDSTLIEALLSAAGRGVDVRVLLPWHSNHVIADWLAHGIFMTLLNGGVQLFGYRNAMIHAKTMVVDGVWSTVGTANLDRLSQIGNHEINLEIYDSVLAANMKTLFEHDLTNAFPITRDWWARRSFYVRGAEIVLTPLRPWL